MQKGARAMSRSPMRRPGASSVAYAVVAGLCIFLGFVLNDVSRVVAAARWVIEHVII